jgi:hypothetical protein
MSRVYDVQAPVGAIVPPEVLMIRCAWSLNSTRITMLPPEPALRLASAVTA